jgi:16S rRNA C967 or C1407 C5-methylase (RsmB/RsmF family)
MDTMSLFDSYFKEIYRERWEGLKSALLQPAEKIQRACFGGFAEYTLDSGSIRAAQALQVKPGDQVLDMCAAPGGKSLILFEALQGRGELIANELSFARRRRLEEVIRSHAPAELQSLARVTGYDGNLFGLKRAGEFNCVLLDAPCSSERHMLEDDAEMKDWKESRTKQLAKRQYSLLCSAILSLKKGGTVVYSTCSISPLENDDVIQRVLDRKGDQVALDTQTDDLSDLEKTKNGFCIFPDRANGAGPMYISRLIRK